jgi:cell division protein FtsI/penicillin-binding protein 2
MTPRDPLHTDERPDAAFESTWRRDYRKRLLVVLVVFTLWTAAIQTRLVYLQVLQHPKYLEEANDQQTRVFEPAPKRGDVLDRDGNLLAYSVDADTIVANPRAVRNPKATVEALCGVFRDCTAKERQDLTTAFSGRRAFAYVRRGVSPDVARQVRELKLAGVAVNAESRRYYPNRTLASHVLGFVGRDNNGLGGIEAAYDSLIRGKSGRVLMLTDAKHRSVQSRVELEPTAGATIELTIDRVIQHIAERELQAGVERHKATAGTAIVMNPKTGEILALANYPDFNPNSPGEVPKEYLRNRATQEIYEPGSTFKMVTAAAALEEGVFAPTDVIDTSAGSITVAQGRKPIRDEHRYPSLTFEEVIIKSSNVGAIKAGWQIGAERLNRYVHRFGFGERHAPDFRGASPGFVWPPESLDASALASVSMGYQVSITPLQMVMATAAIANGGTLLEPRLVRATIKNGVREETEPKTIRTAINRETAAVLTQIMEGVVLRGTAKAAALPDYQVAGKTGTAQKIINKRYSSADHYASFTGFVPSRRPELAILVVIDQPKAGGYYGGVVAAPIFQKIADGALRHLGVPPSAGSTSGSTVVVTAGVRAEAPTPVTPQVERVAIELNGQIAMPDLAGLGARDATRVLTAAGLTLRLHGDGLVVAQSVPAGLPIEPGTTVDVHLTRQPGGRE